MLAPIGIAYYHKLYGKQLLITTETGVASIEAVQPWQVMSLRKLAAAATGAAVLVGGSLASVAEASSPDESVAINQVLDPKLLQSPEDSGTPNSEKRLKTYVFGAGGDLYDDSGPSLRNFAESGATVYRADASWSTAEPTAPEYVDGVAVYDWQWAELDRKVALTANSGLRMQPIIDYAPAWATEDGSPFGIPSASAIVHLKAYARAYALRYGPNGEFWQANPQLPYLPVQKIEANNEPNYNLFFEDGGPVGDAKLYIKRYFEPVRQGIQEAQPDIQVILGGLLYNGNSTRSAMYNSPDHWLKQLSKRMLRDLAERGGKTAIGLHPYGLNPVKGIVALRQQLRELGLGKIPIAVTEMGMYAEMGVSAKDFARQVGRTVALEGSPACNVDGVIMYGFMSNNSSIPTTETNLDGFYSFYSPNGDMTKAGSAILGQLSHLKANPKLCKR